MHQGVHLSIPYSAAGNMSQRRSSVFRNTLIRAAQDIPNTPILKSTAAARLVVALRNSAMKTSARGRRVT